MHNILKAGRYAVCVLLVGGALATAPAAALIVQVANANDLNANDAVYWGQLVPTNTAKSFTAPTYFFSNLGRSVLVSNVTGPNNSFVVDNTPSDFSPARNDPTDSNLTNCCNFSPPFYYGDLTLNFATAVRGIGTYVTGGAGAWIVNVTVNNDPTLTFSVTGDSSTTAGAKIFPFLSVISDNLDISSIRFTSTAAPNPRQNPTGVFQIDNLKLLTTAAAPPPPPPPAPVPEPATWAMLIGGFGLTGAMMRGRRTLAKLQG